MAVDLAIDMINKDPDTLKDYQVEQVWRDTECNAGPTIKAFIDFHTMADKNIVGIVGPGCSSSAKSLGSVTKFFDYAFISYSAESVQLSNDFGNNFLRTVTSTDIHADALVPLFEKYKWRQAKFLAQKSDQGYDTYQEVAIEKLRKQVDKLYNVPRMDLSLPDIKVFSRKPKSEGKWADYEDISKHFRELKTEEDTKKIKFRIFSLRADPDMVWKVMCLAHKERMTWKYNYQWVRTLVFANFLATF